MEHLGVQEGITDYATTNYDAAGATDAARPLSNARVPSFAGHYLQMSARIQYERRPLRPMFLLFCGGGRRY